MYEAPPARHDTGDNYMLAQVKRSDNLEKYLSGEIMPDLIIEHSRDLLDVFKEVGVQ